MGVASSALRHDPFRRGAEGFGQGRLGVAREAGDEEVGGAAARADVVDPQDRVGTCGDTVVREVHPGEVVEVAFGAAGDESGRYRWRWSLGAVAVGVRVAGSVDPVGVVVELQRPGCEREQPVAGGASQPAGEDGDGHADASPVVVGVVGGLRLRWQSAECLELRSDACPSSVEEPILVDHLLAGGVPPVEAADHHAEVGQVDERADPVGVDRLARSDRPNSNRPVVGTFGAHSSASSRTTPASSIGSASSEAWATSSACPSSAGGSR